MKNEDVNLIQYILSGDEEAFTFDWYFRQWAVIFLEEIKNVRKRHISCARYLYQF